MKRLAFVLATALAAGCGGGGTTPNVAAKQPVPQASSPAQQAPQSVSVSFNIIVPTASGASARRLPNYVSASTKSAAIAVGTATPVVVNCTTATCSGTVSAPIGSDTFTVKLYDATSAGGNLLSTGTLTQTIVANTANSVNVTFNGVVESLAVAIGAGTAGTAATIPVTVNALDADGNTIVGPGVYVNASDAPVTITLADSDASGATAASQTTLTQPTTGVTLTYTGLAIVPATVTASAPGLSNGTATFTPTLQPITTNAPLNGATSEIALTRDTSTGNFTASEVGWTNAPYNKSITASEALNCTTVGTTAPASGTSFTTTVAGAPANSSCTLTLSDFAGGNTKPIVLAYVTGSMLFSSAGAQQNFSVPFGVTTLTVAAAGASGGSGFDGGAGAIGGSVTAKIPVATAQETLAVFVGAAGGDGSAGGAGGFNGGFNGGGNGGNAGFAAGGGGGSSDVREGGNTISPTDNRVIVAGGGGGGGADVGAGGGGLGGSASGQSGGNGGLVHGGGGGSQSLSPNGGLDCGIDGGASDGIAGALSLGGDGGARLSGLCSGSDPGAGGGGGYFGGGGGAGGNGAGGGGGGGGSSFIEASALSVTTNTQGTAAAGAGSVTISW